MLPPFKDLGNALCVPCRQIGSIQRGLATLHRNAGMLSRETDFKWGKATEELRVQSKESLTSQIKSAEHGNFSNRGRPYLSSRNESKQRVTLLIHEGETVGMLISHHIKLFWKESFLRRLGILGSRAMQMMLCIFRFCSEVGKLRGLDIREECIH